MLLVLKVEEGTMSQGVQFTFRSWKGKTIDSSGACRRNAALMTLEFNPVRLLTFRTLNNKFVFFKANKLW